MDIRWGNGVPHYHDASDGPDRIYVCRRQRDVDSDLRYWRDARNVDVAMNWARAAVKQEPELKLMLVEVNGSGRKCVGIWPPEEAASAKLESWGEF